MSWFWFPKNCYALTQLPLFICTYLGVVVDVALFSTFVLFFFFFKKNALPSATSRQSFCSFVPKLDFVETTGLHNRLLLPGYIIGYRNREIKLFPKENAKADYISTLIPSIFNRITRSFRIRNGNVLRMESGNRKGDSARGTVMKVDVKINFSGYLVVSSLD